MDANKVIGIVSLYRSCCEWAW